VNAHAAGVKRDIIVVGGSAGAIDALIRLLPQLPPELPAAVLVALHMSPFHTSRLAELLAPQTEIPVEAARDGAPIQHGRVYLAVPDLHLAVDSGRVQLTRGPRIHFTRPAIDVLFRTAARGYGPRVAGVLLAGGGCDGTPGLGDIKAAGGVTLVQDPKLAQHSGMLVSAINSGNVDHVLSLGDIARALPALARGESI
jgi:two-component system chemotaxis response regulator CheB